MPAPIMTAIASISNSRYLDAFDAWRGEYRNPFKDLTAGTRDRNRNDDRRIAELEADGIVAEVIFPNTIPPFFPTGAIVARPPKPDEYELRLAGIRAHNRWLADWCVSHPERRAGIGQIFLNNLDDTIADVRWCHQHGLRGGILLPPVPDDMKNLEPLFSPAYDRLWAECQDLGVVVNTHSGGAGAPDYGSYRASSLAWIAETTFFSRRPLTHMLISGAFERYPDLQFALTEQGCAGSPTCWQCSIGSMSRCAPRDEFGELKYQPDEIPPLRPSEYFARNCWVGVSFPSPTEAAARHAIGIDRFMWGSDYPHDESTYPNTREALRRSFRGATPHELDRVLGRNAAALYRFDLDALAPIAQRHGPTAEELAEPYDGIPEGNRSPAFAAA